MEIDLITLHLIFFFFLLIEKFFTFSSTLQFQKVFHKLKAHPVWAMESFSRNTVKSYHPEEQ